MISLFDLLRAYSREIEEYAHKTLYFVITYGAKSFPEIGIKRPAVRRVSHLFLSPLPERAIAFFVKPGP